MKEGCRKGCRKGNPPPPDQRRLSDLMSLIKGYDCAGHFGLRAFVHAAYRGGKEPAYPGWIALAKGCRRDAFGVYDGGAAGCKTNLEQPIQIKPVGDPGASLRVPDGGTAGCEGGGARDRAVAECRRYMHDLARARLGAAKQSKAVGKVLKVLSPGSGSGSGQG